LIFFFTDQLLIYHPRRIFVTRPPTMFGKIAMNRAQQRNETM